MKVIFAADHAGFVLKEELKAHVVTLGYEVEDMGAYAYDANDDYPDIIAPAALAIAAQEQVRGIILGGSGQGEAMVANRIPGVRAVVYYGEPMGEHHERIITLSREHNDANILSLGARFLTSDEAKEAVTTWLATGCSSDERHARRIAKID
jgi:ribose 5-phosphate isomerase B